MPELIPEKQKAFALEVVQRLRTHGRTAYWAGGCVRDQLLGRTPKDYDVATDAEPGQICDFFSNRTTLEIGAAFGVVTVVGPHGAGQIDVATFRRDAEYSDGRHPDAVEFSGPEEDAKRRDFTINGLFFDPIDQKVIDFVEGRRDLELGIIRAIGDPCERFGEDKLRMLRGVRFAATFNFEIEQATLEAIRSMADQINVVSPERIAQEMRVLLVSPARVRAMNLLLECGLLAAILPEVLPMRGLAQHKPRQPQGDLWDHTMLVLDELRDPSFPLAMGALLHDVGKPQTLTTIKGRTAFYDHETVGARMSADICRRWRLSRREEGRICWLVKHHMYLGEARKMRWAKLQRMLVSEGIEELLALHEADALASTGDTTEVEYCRMRLNEPPEKLKPPPLLNGHDLIRHGVPQGQTYQMLLEKAYDAQLEGTIHSKREALALVDRLLAEQGSGDRPTT